MDNRQAIVECLAASAEIFGKTVSEHGKMLWFRILRDHDAEAIKRAFTAYLTDGEPFMPKPSDIVKLIDGTTSDKALAAWTKTLRAIQTVGSYDSVVFDDPLIHAVVADMDGWQALCQITEHETPFKAAEFQKRYAAYQRRPPGVYPPQLTGRHEAENRLNGYDAHVKPPVAIGDARKCERVRIGGTARSEGPKRLTEALPQIERRGDAA